MQVVEAQTANGRCSIRVRVHSLPQQVAAALDDSEAVMSRTLTDDSGGHFKKGGKIGSAEQSSVIYENQQ